MKFWGIPESSRPHRTTPVYATPSARSNNALPRDGSCCHAKGTRSGETGSAEELTAVRGPIGREHRAGRCGDLVARDVANVLRESPLVAEGVEKLSVAVAPELLLERSEHRGPGIDGPLPRAVDALGEDVQHDRRPTEGKRR